MTSIGVPIHCAASEPGIDVLRIAARPASNAATHASRVSRSVPSMSKRTARSRGTSRLLLSEPPDVVAHMVSGLDRLAFLLAGHCGSVHDRAPNRERPAVLLVRDPDDVARANPGVCVHDARGHSDSGTRPGKIILVWASRYLSMQTIEVSRTQRPRTAGPEHATKSDPVAVPGRPSFARGFPAPTSARRAPHHTIHPGLPDSARGPRRTRPWPASVDPDATGTRPFAGTRGRGRPWSHE